MADQTELDMEFLPSDDIVEPELAGAEDDAVHVREWEELRGRMAADAEDFESDELEDEGAEALEAEATEIAAEAEAAHEEAQEADQDEEDVEEILHRHYGIVSAADEDPARPTSAGEFACRSCFLRKPTSQLADPERSICVDCVANAA